MNAHLQAQPNTNKSPQSWLESLIEALFREPGGAGHQVRSLAAFSMGAMAALLLLFSMALELRHVAWSFSVGLVLISLGALASRPFKHWTEFHWGTLTLLVVGFGAGGLAYLLKWVPDALWARAGQVAHSASGTKLLAAFFLLGVILGFFVVRNWKQEQENFLKSLGAALGGAFATVVAPKLDASLGTVETFSLYAFGFALSGAVNLVLFAVLSAAYTVRRSQTSRTLVEVLYGHDLAAALDKHFEENFQRDPVFARRMLVESIDLHRKHTLRELAAWYEKKRHALAGSEGDTGRAFFRLLSVQRDKTAEAGTAEAQYDLFIEQLATKIDEHLFRMNVAAKRNDLLDIIVPPDARRPSFIYSGSVAGLAMLSHQPIVMYRDSQRMVRVGDHESTPGELQQARGDQLEYLSYISIPLLGETGDPANLGNGVVNIDTRLFLQTPGDLGTEGWVPVNGTPHQWTLHCKNEDELKAATRWLRSAATELYHDSELVPWLCEHVEPLAPLVALYLKCDVGVE